jgi:choline dehydrogenase-like flavoprotein
MTVPVDVVIVGAGAAGGVMAKELSEGGLNVVVLEKGRKVSPADASHDELNGRNGIPGLAGQLLDLDKNPRRFRLDASSPSRVGYDGFNAFGLGGGTSWYGAAAWRFHEEHFRMRSTYGRPAGTSLEDWPISYDDLEPYYEKAEYELGVSGLAGADPFAAPRKRPYPLPPLPLNAQGELFAKATRKLGLHPFPPPFAVITQNYRGRTACVRCPFCIEHVCEVRAKSSTAVTMLPLAVLTGKCQIRAQCVVERVLVDTKGRATGVRFFDEQGQPQIQEAKLVVISANAAESARLLLNSATPGAPRGLANSSDMVGRNLMSHIGANSFGVFDDQELLHQQGPGPSMAINDFVRGRLGGAHIYNFYVHHPAGFAFTRPPGFPRWGKAHKDFQRRYFNRFLWLNSDVADMPVFESRVDIDPELRDAWGIPVARITRTFHPLDFENSAFIEARQREILEAAGATHIWSGGVNKREIAAGEHQCGTCRMGNDPKTSVLNQYCQTHDVDNLFVADTSCFVSFPGHNPSLTAQAIAFRSSEYILREWRGGAFTRQ